MSWTNKLTRHEEPISHIAKADIKEHAPPEELKKFNEWLCGQTMLLRSDGDSGIYTWDFDRWVGQGKVNKQNKD